MNLFLGLIENTLFFTLRQSVTGATSATGVLNKNTVLFELLDILQCRIIFENLASLTYLEVFMDLILKPTVED